VPQSSPNLVTALLVKWRAGDEQALEALLPLVYNELRRAAHRYLRHERPDHTLQSTALVHEVYLRLLKQGTHEFENRAHFFAISAQLCDRFWWSTLVAGRQRSAMADIRSRCMTVSACSKRGA